MTVWAKSYNSSWRKTKGFDQDILGSEKFIGQLTEKIETTVNQIFSKAKSKQLALSMRCKYNVEVDLGSLGQSPTH